MGLLLKKDERTDLAGLLAVPVPKHTRSWRPMPYGDIVGYVKELIDRTIGAPIINEEYGLNKTGDQMFAQFAIDVGDEGQALSFGLRSSYNKSLAPAMVAGSQLMVCSNLCFSGNALKLVRKNTTNVWNDFRSLAQTHVQNSLGYYANVKADNERMKTLPCSERRGYAMLGVALGEGVLSPQQATVAFGDWKEPRHEEFADRNLWGLYNAVTEGLKKGAPGQRIDRQTRAHDYFQAMQGLE